MKSASLSLLLLLSFLRFTALKKHISPCRITNKWGVVLPRHYSQVIEEQSVETLPCKQSPNDKGKERVVKENKKNCHSFYWTIISGTPVFRCPTGLNFFPPDTQCIFSKDDAIIPFGNNGERKGVCFYFKKAASRCWRQRKCDSIRKEHHFRWKITMYMNNITLSNHPCTLFSAQVI